MVKYHTLQRSQCATVAQPVEQLTRNEQVVRSNRISSSKYRLPENQFKLILGEFFVYRFHRQNFVQFSQFSNWYFGGTIKVEFY